jgi:hypothetical protein
MLLQMAQFNLVDIKALFEQPTVALSRALLLLLSSRFFSVKEAASLAFRGVAYVVALALMANALALFDTI